MTESSSPARPPRGGHPTAAFDDDRFSFTRATRTRRRLVVAEAALLGVLGVITALTVATDAGLTIWYVVTWTVALLAFIPVHSLLNAGIRGLYDRSGRSLDEHQRQVRAQSYEAVRWPSYALTLAAWVGAVATGSVARDTELALAVGFLLWFAATLLSYWHLAWTMPGEDAGAEEAELAR